jgi:hypothetical protein
MRVFAVLPEQLDRINISRDSGTLKKRGEDWNAVCLGHRERLDGERINREYGKKHASIWKKITLDLEVAFPKFNVSKWQKNS